MILALKTSEDPVEIYLLSDSSEIIKEKKWQAERTLAKNLLKVLSDLVEGDFSQLTGVVVFRGSGSFTGLRIGITVANTIAYSENLPIVGALGKNWLADGVEDLKASKNDKIVVPEYGAEANISKPRK